MAQSKVIIVGGGNAGLSAAYQLHKAGVPFTLLEATDRIGGRVKECDWQDIHYNDGAAFTEPQWETTFEYLRDFGLIDNVFEPETKIYGLWLNGERRDFEDTGNLFESLLKMKGIPMKMVAQGAKFLPALLGAMGKVGENHDFSKLTEISKQTTREWVCDHGGSEIADKLLGPMLGTMTLARTCDVSAAHPIALMKLMKGMDGVIGGLKSINEAIYDVIKDDVRLNTPVDEILIEDDAIKGVRLASGEVLEAEKVICCTDAVDALALMPALPQVMRDALGTCTYCKTWHYVFYSPRKLFPDGYMASFIPESEDSIITTIFAATPTEADIVPGAEVVHDFSGNATLAHTFTAGWHDDELWALDEEARHRRVAEEVAKYTPGFDLDEIEVVAANRMERAINLEPPGQFEAIEDLKNNHLDDVKGLYLGGEYMFLIACTEGAWMTGKQAGKKIIAEQ